jgi:glycosyltransferase involved in cell wall biosynthesis
LDGSEFIRVTIGLCVKNDESSIRKCLESILNQDFPHYALKLIIVDGNSVDKTLSIIKEVLLKADLKFFIFQENVGLAYARQLAVEYAEGEYLLFVDGDMMLSSDYVTKMVRFMDNNPDVGIAGGRFKMCKLEKSSLVYKLNYLEKLVDYHF